MEMQKILLLWKTMLTGKESELIHNWSPQKKWYLSLYPNQSSFSLFFLQKYTNPLSLSITNVLSSLPGNHLIFRLDKIFYKRPDDLLT